jgi:hypothetical protein
MTDRIDTAALRDAMEAEREAFEAWARGEDSFRLHRPRGSCSYDDSTSQSAWEAWQARSSLDTSSAPWREGARSAALLLQQVRVIPRRGTAQPA